MTTLLLRARNGLFLTAIGLMLLSLIAPAVTLADTSLSPGAAAVVAGTNGDGVALRSDMSTDSQVLQTIPEGTPLQIQDGPLTAADGSVWYSVSVNGATGYVSAQYVSGAAGNAGNGTTSNTEATQAPTEAPTQAATQAPVTGPAASTIPWKQPVAYGVVNDNIKQGVPQIGIVCRADVSTEAAKITEVYLGDTIEVTGQQIQNEGLTWLPVNCAGVGGFIDANFIAVNTQAAPAAQATDAPTEAPTQAPTQAAAEVATLAPTEVVTQAPTEATQADPTEAATQAPAGIAQNGASVATTAPATDVPATTTATEAPTGTQPPTNSPDTQAPASGTPTTQTASTPAAAASAGGVSVAGDGGSVTTKDGNVAVSGAAGSISIDGNGTPVITTPATTATVTATEAASETPVTTVEASTPAASTASTTAATSTSPQTLANDTVNQQNSSTPSATTTTTAPTQVATQDASATATPGVDLSKAIGSATVQGTNGDGVVCRVAPSSDAAAITVLAEGTKVMVMGNPSNGWLPIACADQLGYAPVQYMWQGGAVQGDFSGSGAGSTVTVQGTGGGLNCRSGAGTSYPVITVLPDGTTLTMRGQPSGDWLPVTCAGQDGWVNIQYVSSPQGSGSNSGSNGANGSNNGGSGATGTATVTGTGGDGVRCRASASTSGAIITVLPEGSTVTTTGAAANGWQPVSCAGQSGFVSSQYLTLGGSGSNGDTSGNGSNGGGTSNGGGATGGTVTVTGTGNGLNCRSGAGTSYPVITVVFDGTTLTVRGAASNGWLPVVCASQNGFVSTAYVTADGSAGGGSNNGGSSNGGSNGGGSQVTGTATVTGTGGDGVRCRASASTSGAIITVVPEGATVSLTGSASNGWQPVLCGGQNGYISAQYLSTGGGSGSNNGGGTPTPTPTPGSGGSTSGLANGDHAQTTDVLNLRYQPSLGAGIATTAPAGTVVLITGGINNGFYPVDWDGLKGWMSGDYLVKTDAALSKRGGSANGGGSTSGGGGSSSGGTATGNAIVNYAEGYLGYPYVWNTHGPSSFDCSGFTYWVILHVLGIDIGTGLWTQVNGGTPVARSDIQPGDLVFFQNTYEAGLSHVGIYIGNGQFIHAENEQTGVKISDLGSDYYSSRWYGAVRYS